MTDVQAALLRSLERPVAYLDGQTTHSILNTWPGIKWKKLNFQHDWFSMRGERGGGDIKRF